MVYEGERYLKEEGDVITMLFQKGKKEEYLKAQKVANRRVKNKHYTPILTYTHNDVPIYNAYPN